MYWATGLPGWNRLPAAVPWAMPYYSSEDEAAELRDQAAALKDQLRAVENRLQSIASGVNQTNESPG
jgi:hypothetical protein